jgi:hypothetical protein
LNGIPKAVYSAVDVDFLLNLTKHCCYSNVSGILTPDDPHDGWSSLQRSVWNWYSPTVTIKTTAPSILFLRCYHIKYPYLVQMEVKVSLIPFIVFGCLVRPPSTAH